jgi:hypothetical protein
MMMATQGGSRWKAWPTVATRAPRGSSACVLRVADHRRPGARHVELSVDRAHDVTYRSRSWTTAPLVPTVDPGIADLGSCWTTLASSREPRRSGCGGGARLAATDIPLDSMDLEDVRAADRDRGRRAPGRERARGRAAEPLRKDRVYRVELAVENASGLPAEPEGGRTFRPLYEGPAVWPAERLPWEDPAAPPPAPPPAGRRRVAGPAGPRWLPAVRLPGERPPARASSARAAARRTALERAEVSASWRRARTRTARARRWSAVLERWESEACLARPAVAGRQRHRRRRPRTSVAPLANQRSGDG